MLVPLAVNCPGSGNGLSVKVSFCVPGCRGICLCWAAVGIWLAIVTRSGVGTL